MEIARRNNVTVTGNPQGRTVMLAHGFGCDQNMWRLTLPALTEDYRVVLFDYVGSGRSDGSAFSEDRYASLEGYAQDVVEVCEALDLRETVFVGHSVSAMIGVLAAGMAPERIGAHVMVAPSPRYIDDDGYHGGFGADDIDELLASLDSDYLGWSAAMAPVITGNADRPELGEELKNSFCATDPDMARVFARTTFLSDSRDDLKSVDVPPLVLECTQDVIAPREVGAFVHEAIPGSTLVHSRCDWTLPAPVRARSHQRGNTELPGGLDAAKSHAPVLAIAGQVPLAELRSDYLQEIDNDALFSDVAVFRATITSPDQLPQMLETPSALRARSCWTSSPIPTRSPSRPSRPSSRAGGSRWPR